ncbi:DUF3037 domain-containing protein [Halomonas icarae]|uniref:DUF3037 domain-containing protein n=1 Tax=Halomonas icarae TaxID=2691040 RepID=A0A7X5AKD6_9GAMM|nr:DUF3037 domain-containing protein [Halomonas icarae]MDR5903009.1 DUF3037 domain-containing protein [Halomonas icarae]NAW11566.1 DUF3037 domain-containing protein [Halomonas icarae]
MKRIACQYAIVRFMPYVETGEFANVGVVMISPRYRYFGFRLETRRYARLTQFFKDLEGRLYRSAIYAIKEELERVHALLKENGFDRRYKHNDEAFAKQLFTELTRPRETMLRFSEPRVVLAEKPEERLDELFGHYVEHSFATKRYRETVMESQLRRLLMQASVGERFSPEKLGDEEYHVNFPFVEKQQDQVLRAIKPLNLGQQDSSLIVEHGGKWQFRINELKRRRQLPRRVLFAVEGPDDDSRRGEAYHHAVALLQETGVSVLPLAKKEALLEFVGTQ